MTNLNVRTWMQKNTQKDDFDQQTACIAPVDLLKYTTLKEEGGGAQILSYAPGPIWTWYGPAQACR